MSDADVEALAQEIRGVFWYAAEGDSDIWLAIARYVYPRLARPAPDPAAAFRQAAEAFTAQHTASEAAANACLVDAGIQDASGDLTAEYQENPADEKDEA